MSAEHTSATNKPWCACKLLTLPMQSPLAPVGDSLDVQNSQLKALFQRFIEHRSAVPGRSGAMSWHQFADAVMVQAKGIELKYTHARKHLLHAACQTVQPVPTEQHPGKCNQRLHLLGMQCCRTMQLHLLLHSTHIQQRLPHSTTEATMALSCCRHLQSASAQCSPSPPH